MARKVPSRVPGTRYLIDPKKLSVSSRSKLPQNWKPGRSSKRLKTSKNSAIFRALKKGGCKFSSDDLGITLNLPNQIEWVLRLYVSDMKSAMSPARFRAELRKFTKRLSMFAEGFPPDASVLDEAFREQLNREEGRYREASKANADDILGPLLSDPDVFMERTSKAIRLLQLVAADILDEERGRGRPSDRANDNLMLGLRDIWFDFTGREPGQGGDPHEKGYRSPFERFADAAVAVLPRRYRPKSTRYLTRRVREKSAKKT